MREVDDSAGEGGIADGPNAATEVGGIGRPVWVVADEMDLLLLLLVEEEVKKADEKSEGEPCGEVVRDAGGEKKE